MNNEKVIQQAKAAIAIGENKSPKDILDIYDMIEDKDDIAVIYMVVCKFNYKQFFELFELYKKKYSWSKQLCDEYIISLTNDLTERSLLLQMYVRIYGCTDFYNCNKI
jgi:hypothetical protein